MTEENFLSRVQRELHSDDTARATEASVAVLRTLTETMTPAEAHTLARHLPPGLLSRIEPRLPSGGGQHAVGFGD